MDGGWKKEKMSSLTTRLRQYLILHATCRAWWLMCWRGKLQIVAPLHWLQPHWLRKEYLHRQQNCNKQKYILVFDSCHFCSTAATSIAQLSRVEAHQLKVTINCRHLSWQELQCFGGEPISFSSNAHHRIIPCNDSTVNALFATLSAFDLFLSLEFRLTVSVILEAFFYDPANLYLLTMNNDSRDFNTDFTSWVQLLVGHCCCASCISSSSERKQRTHVLEYEYVVG